MSTPVLSLPGAVVAVTGGARGIGRATAAAFLRAGARVAIGDVDAELAERTARELGADVVALDLDVTDRASFGAFLERTEQALGPVDVLVNNAGIMPLGPFLEESDAAATRQVDINLHGVMLGMKLALPGMRTRGRGHIVNLASTAGKAGIPGGATYSATKHAVVGLSEAVAGELRGEPVRVSIILPVLVDTELTAGVSAARGMKTQSPENVADAVLDVVRSGRFEAFVPRSVGTINRVMAVLPRAGRDALARAFRADHVLSRADASRRRAYEERAARSEPALAPPPGDPSEGGGSSEADGRLLETAR